LFQGIRVLKITGPFCQTEAEFCFETFLFYLFAVHIASLFFIPAISEQVFDLRISIAPAGLASPAA